METAKITMNGQQQTVILPMGFKLPGDEVCVKKVGNAILLFPKDTAWINFINSHVVDDDFVDAIISGHQRERLTIDKLFQGWDGECSEPYDWGDLDAPAGRELL